MISHTASEARVKVVVPTERGDEALLTILGPGELFGEFALLDNEPRSATVVAIEPVETLTLGRRDFLHLLQRSPAMAQRLLVVLAKTIRRNSDEMCDLMFVDLRARLAKKLVELAESHGRQTAGSVTLQLPLTQEELAGMVGATRTSINKVLRFYESQGTLVRHGRQIVIVELSVLRSWAAR